MFSLLDKPQRATLFCISKSFNKLSILLRRSYSPLIILYALYKDLPQRIYYAAKKFSKFTNIKNQGARRKLAETSSDLVKKPVVNYKLIGTSLFHGGRRSLCCSMEIEKSAIRLACFEEYVALSSGITLKQTLG